MSAYVTNSISTFVHDIFDCRLFFSDRIFGFLSSFKFKLLFFATMVLYLKLSAVHRQFPFICDFHFGK